MKRSNPRVSERPGWLRRSFSGGIIPVLVLMFALLAAPMAPAAAPSYFYYSGDSQCPIGLVTDRFAVRFKAGVDPLMATAGDRDLSLARETYLDGRFGLEILNISSGRDGSLIGEDAVIDKIREFNSRSNVEVATPIFSCAKGDLILTDEIIVRFSDHLTDGEVAEISAAYGTRVLRRHSWAPHVYVIQVAGASWADALTTANTMHEDERVLYSHPNFVGQAQLSRVPFDEYYPEMWNLNNTGQGDGIAGSDISAEEGWDLMVGNPLTVVAIIDGHGVDTHTELDDYAVLGYDAYSGDNDPTPNFPCEGHGTCCAGIACAETDNANGVSGVGYNIGLMAVKIGSDPDCDGSFTTTPEIIADGITTATDRGAEVLSNSWGWIDFDAIHDAIIYAKTTGRGGRGTVVCCAAGNFNTTPIDYPARYPECIAVGATNWCDHRKKALNNPCNNYEYWWGSNYGPALDVVAPGLALWTTDNPGVGGYNPGDVGQGDAGGAYYKWFNGTSGACPHVAALAALVITAQPTLTAAQVFARIINGADDEVGTPDEDTPGWDQYMGWGRINMFNTMMLVDQPDLLPYAAINWDYPVVPRNTNDAHGAWCHLPDTLYGNLETTYLNYCFRNEADVGCGWQYTIIYVDEVSPVGLDSMPPMDPWDIHPENNWGPYTVRGGRHTVRLNIDAQDYVIESDEGNNEYERQFIWTPLELTNGNPVRREGVPMRGNMTYPNCDGFEFTINLCGAVAMIPFDIQNDYDMRMHYESTGSEDGFGPWLEMSSAPTGYSDFVILNGRMAGFGETRNVSVYWAAGVGYRDSMLVEYVESSGMIPHCGTWGDFSIASDGTMDLYELTFAKKSHYTVELEIVNGDANLGLSVYDWDDTSYDKYEALIVSDFHGDGEGEKISFSVDTLRVFPLAVWKHGSSDIGKLVFYKLHIYETPPNLQAYVPPGWDYPVVPRDDGGALYNDCQLTDSLLGDVTGTYVNIAWWNAGPDTAGPHQTSVFLDSELLTYWTVGLMTPGNWAYGGNGGPYFVRGGRHTMSDTCDIHDVVLETVETDNGWGFQYVWSPAILASDTPLYRAAPPERGTWTWPNCDGFQFTGTWWSAVGTIPLDDGDDYDVSLHDPYVGSLDGFGGPHEISNDIAGMTDIVLVNGNNIVVGYGATRDAGVFEAVPGNGNGFYVQRATSQGTWDVPFATPGYTLGPTDVLDIYDVNIPVGDMYLVHVDIMSGDADLVVGFYDPSEDYMEKYETYDDIPPEDNGGPGEDEMFTIPLGDTGRFGVAIWKKDYRDIGRTATYSLRITNQMVDLTDAEPSGWAYPVVPRSADDASQYDAQPTLHLVSNVDSTWLNFCWTNDGSDSAEAHYTKMRIDGEQIALYHQSSPVAPGESVWVNNYGPYEVRGGRHTLSMEVDGLHQIIETDEDNNIFSQQLVWQPMQLPEETPVVRLEPPDVGDGPYPNCDGFYKPKVMSAANVTAMCPHLKTPDYDLYLYDDYASNQSGFSNLKAVSSVGSQAELEFVGTRFNGTAMFPAAILVTPYYGPFRGQMTVYATSSAGRTLSGLPITSGDSLPAGHLLNVYTVLLFHTTYDIEVWQESGQADLAIAVMPPAESYFGRGEALVEMDGSGGGDDEYLTFSTGGQNWFDIVVFKTDYTSISEDSKYTFYVAENSLAGVTAHADPEIPLDFVLEPNRPNPFESATVVRYGVPSPGTDVSIRVFDTLGRLVVTLVDGYVGPGFHELTWGGAGGEVGPGIYFIRMQAGEFRATRKMMLLR